MSTCPICPGCEGPYPGPARTGFTLYTEAETMRADQRYYLNADKSRVVDGDSPEAAHLLAAEGDDISTEDAKRYGLGRYAPDEGAAPAAEVSKTDEEPKTDEAPPDAKAVGGPTEDKAVDGPAENKAGARRRAGKGDEGA